jgi:hypothetical protein
LTQRERLLTALDGGQPDQVPVTWELVNRCALALTGSTGWRAMCDAHRLIGSAIFNLQGVGPALHTELPGGHEEFTRDRGEHEGWHVVEHVIRTPHGQLTSIVHAGGIADDPLVHKVVTPFVDSSSDWEIYAEHLDAWMRNAHFDTAEADAAKEYVGDDGLVNFWMADSLYALAGARRSDEFVLDLVDMPKEMQKLHDKMHERTALGIEAFNASGADVLVYDICWASTSLLSPDLCERFVVPEAKWAVESIAPGKRIVFFTSGRIRDVLPSLVDCRPDGIQHLDVLGDCDLAEVKQSFGDKVCLMGNYNPVVLAHGDVTAAKREARRCLRDAAEGGGYIMSTSDEVPGDAKLANMQAVVKVVAKEGRYEA